MGGGGYLCLKGHEIDTQLFCMVLLDYLLELLTSYSANVDDTLSVNFKSIDSTDGMLKTLIVSIGTKLQLTRQLSVL